VVTALNAFADERVTPHELLLVRIEPWLVQDAVVLLGVHPLVGEPEGGGGVGPRDRVAR
jgi:hypothetical protein